MIHVELVGPTQLMQGLVATPLSTGLVRLDVDMEADPIGLSPTILAELARQMGGVASWQWRKEMLRDPNAKSGAGVFEPLWIDNQRLNIRNPIRRMEVSGDGKLYEKSDGRLRIWIPPDKTPGHAPANTQCALMTFGIGMDVGAGSGQSDSTIEGFAVENMEQAFEWNDNTTQPANLGRIAAAIARYYNDALVCCVQKMHGITAIRSMIDYGYTNLWRNTSPDKMVETANGGSVGWKHGENSDALLMDRVGDRLENALGEAVNVDVLSARSVIVHSSMLLDQLRMYIYDDSGRPTLSKHKDLNPSARKQHGDLVIGAGLSIRACMDSPPYRVLSYNQIPDGCAEARHMARMARKVDQERW